MRVAIVAALVLLVSGLIALGLVLLPSVGLRRDPRASIRVSGLGAAVAAAAFGIQVAVPLTNGLPVEWPFLRGNYFLAMGHFFMKDFPYPFFWSPPWEYRVGALTPLIAAGGALAVAAAYPALRAGRRGAVVSMLIGLGAIGVYVASAAYAARATWYGVPV